ncbi:exonuclease domain-containing protein [Corynebacterium sp. CCM 8835]|uniref:Exonuclease domain-containing protein n=1 Tax=Corynebacterium antarcticum TaxID=2800405 RepID=A0ABS1FNP4_9CORY|nr:exonuclease domain-containing protein [Corynebacterium antarcticum]MCK7641945.1 exonuclease domain-containing protein [Corynebacterium antarcticum]MCL0245170.1 exonuclease domain-containing protein [Corynebacterium antarcticum]
MIRPSFAVIDFETTGFLPSDRVLEIGLALTDAHGRLQRTWQTLVQPNRHFDNTAIHGIRPADVADAPCFAEVAAEFAALIDGRVIVAHNAAFDTKFLVREFATCGVDLDDPRDWSVCTMRTAKSVLPGAPQKLSECLSTIGAVNCNPHAALADAVATAELLGDLLRRTDVVRSRTPLSLTPENHRTLAGVPSLPPVERGHRSLSAVDGQWLDALAAGLPDTGDRDVDDYLRLLRAAMADGKLCTSEIRQLICRAGELGIDREEAGEIHGRFVRQLAVEAWADGVVTDAEREAVTTAARQLGVDGALVEALLARPVEGEGFERLRLSPGDRVTFTGELALPREDWEQRARAAGLDVGGVCRRSVLLVAADPDTASRKARRARELDVPIVEEATFARLLREMNEGRPGEREPETEKESDDGAPEAPAADVEDPRDLTRRIFPWLDQVLGGEGEQRAVEPDQITVAWMDWGGTLPLHQLSPMLSPRTVPGQVAVKPANLARHLARYAEPLGESLANLSYVRGVGARSLHRLVYSLVLAVIDDAEEGKTCPDPAPEPDESSLYDAEDPVYLDGDTAREPASTELQLVVRWAALAGMLPELPDTAPDHIRAAAEELSGHPELAAPEVTAVRAALGAVEEALAVDERLPQVFARRVVGGETLDALGESFGVTRERVRQIQHRVTSLIEQPPADMLTAVTALAHRFLPATPLAEVENEVPTLAQPCPVTGGPAIQTIAAFATTWELSSGWIVRQGLVEAIRQAVVDTADEYGVSTVAAIARETGVDEATLTAFAADANLNIGIPVRGKLCTRCSNYGDRAVALLAIAGQPLTADTVFEAFGTGNIRSMSNALSADPRIVRVGRDTWALTEWGMEEFQSLAHWIAARVDADGSAPLTELIEGAQALGLAETSVRTYCTNGEFITVDGVVTRNDGPVENTADPDDVRGLYHRGTDRELLVTVTGDHVRGSGSGVPRGVAAMKDVPFLGKVAMPTRLGRDQFIAWNRTGATITSIRDFLLDLDLMEGQRIWLVFADDGGFDIRRATAVREDLDGWAGLLNKLGLDERVPGDLGEVSGGEALAIINTALGLSPDAPLRRTVAMFNHRREEDIADAIRDLIARE